MLPAIPRQKPWSESPAPPDSVHQTLQDTLAPCPLPLTPTRTPSSLWPWKLNTTQARSRHTLMDSAGSTRDWQRSKPRTGQVAMSRHCSPRARFTFFSVWLLPSAAVVVVLVAVDPSGGPPPCFPLKEGGEVGAMSHDQHNLNQKTGEFELGRGVVFNLVSNPRIKKKTPTCPVMSGTGGGCECDCGWDTQWQCSRILSRRDKVNIAPRDWGGLHREKEAGNIGTSECQSPLGCLVFDGGEKSVLCVHCTHWVK